MSKRTVFLRALLVAVILLALCDRTIAQSPGLNSGQKEKISFEAAASHDDSTDNSQFWMIVLTIHAEQGWRVYRPGADEFTIPVEPELELPVGVRQIGEWKFPSAEGDLGHLGDGQKISCRVSAQDTETVRNIVINVRYQACSNSVCLPPETVELDLKNATGPDQTLPQTKQLRIAALDVLNKPVDNREVYNLVLELAQKMIAETGNPDVDELNRQMKRAPSSSGHPVPATELPTPDKVYESMLRSSLIVANVYDCGKCDKQHVSTAGGVVVGADGLVLTNHHVVEKSNPGTLGLVVVTSQGVCHPIVEVLSASASDDVALIRVGGDTSDLHPAPIASTSPEPMTPLIVISHPHREYFVLTEGKVSRYVTDSRSERTGTIWMETTADYGAGSSGSAVFNEAGEVVGLVSTVFPLIRKGDKPDAAHPPDEEGSRPSGSPGKPDLLEMLLHRCVPLNAIRNRFSSSRE